MYQTVTAVNIYIFNRIKGYIGEHMFIKWNCLQSRISQGQRGGMRGQGVVWGRGGCVGVQGEGHHILLNILINY